MIVNETELLARLPEDYDYRNRAIKNTRALSELGKAIIKAKNKSFADLRTPIIAGGSIRDTMFGYEPKDFDIFFDVSSFPQEERQDATLLFGLRIIDEIGDLDMFRLFKDVDLIEKGQNYSEDGSTVSETWKEFYVCDTSVYNNLALQQWFREEAEVADTAVMSKLQFIGHADERLTRNPVEFLDSFDYGLVKAFYDPETELYTFTDEFVESLNTRKIVVDSASSFERASNWNSKWAHGFEVVKNYEEVATKPVLTNPCSEIILPVFQPLGLDNPAPIVFDPLA